MIAGNPYTKFWNTLNELSSPGYGTVLHHHHHKADEKDGDDYEWDGMALYSVPMEHRYVVTRVWDRNLPLFGAVLLNPSTATGHSADPTVERVLERVRLAGIYGGLVLMNIFALRSTDPTHLRSHVDPVGRENNTVLQRLLPHCSKVMCGWGNHGKYYRRGEHVEMLIRSLKIDPQILDLTKSGYPIHPLYQSYQKKLKPWSASK